jgi:hypothetical protein
MRPRSPGQMRPGIPVPLPRRPQPPPLTATTNHSVIANVKTMRLSDIPDEVILACRGAIDAIRGQGNRQTCSAVAASSPATDRYFADVFVSVGGVAAIAAGFHRWRVSLARAAIIVLQNLCDTVREAVLRLSTVAVADAGSDWTDAFAQVIHLLDCTCGGAPTATDTAEYPSNVVHPLAFPYGLRLSIIRATAAFAAASPVYSSMLTACGADVLVSRVQYLTTLMTVGRLVPYVHSMVIGNQLGETHVSERGTLHAHACTCTCTCTVEFAVSTRTNTLV